jgi:stress response protein SCP2
MKRIKVLFIPADVSKPLEVREISNDLTGMKSLIDGGWPYQIICHYDGETFGFCSYTEGDLDIKEFPTREERDHATDEYFCWFNQFHDVTGAPVSLDDDRLGPCDI